MRFSNRGKKICRNRLYTVYKGKKHKDTKIERRESKIFGRALAKNRNNLPWKKLKKQKGKDRYNQGYLEIGRAHV